MIYLMGAIIIALSGYCIALLLKLTRDHFLHDIALGWFLGAGYYSVSMFFLVYAAGLPAKALYSVLIILVPFIYCTMRIKVYLPYIIQSIRNVRTIEYLPRGRIISFETLFVCYSIFMIILVIAHGASTPTNADDAIHLRAYSPMLVYMNDMSEKSRIVIVANGIWPSFLTVFFWHINGGLDHFYINYTILTSFICFLLLLYLTPAIRGENRQGIYNVSLVLALPLFAYHITTTYSDARMIMPFTIGFLLFIFYLKDLNVKDFKTMILFFIITSLIKDKGIILGFTGLSLSMLFLFYVNVKKKDYSFVKIILYTFPAVLLGSYLLFKTRYASNVWSPLGNVVKSLSAGNGLTAFNEVLVNVVKPVLSGDPANWSATPYMIKLNGFIKSMFSSGNFGIIYYLVLVNLLLNIKKTVKTLLVWEFAFLAIVFLESFYFTVVLFNSLSSYSSIVHRVVMIPAVISCIYLSSLWTNRGCDYREKAVG